MENSRRQKKGPLCSVGDRRFREGRKIEPPWRKNVAKAKVRWLSKKSLMEKQTSSKILL